MALTSFKPDDPFPKGRGDNIRSKDWNDLVKEALRLGGAKVDRAGDAVTGSLTVSGALGVGLTQPQQALSVNGSMNIDQANSNDGKIGAGALSFGSASGEGMASKRTAGGNQFGLDFYAGSQPRLSITNDGRVGIGTGAPNPNARLDVQGAIFAGNSDIYFAKTDHNHSGLGNADGLAAIENATNFGALMILGRTTPAGRIVKLWDFLQVNGNLEVAGNIIDTKFRLTQVFNQRQGPVPFAATFASGGGTLLIMVSGTAWTTGSGNIGIVIQLDGSSIGTARTFTNEPNSHKALASNPLVQRNVNAGTHTLSFVLLTNTTSDFNDWYSATVLELPF